LRSLLADGKVRPSDLVWRDGISNWAPAAESRELCPAPAAAVKPRPAPAAAAPVDDLPLARDDPAPRPRRRYEDDDDYDPPRPRLRRREEGMSTGAKIAMFGGIAAFLLFGLIVIGIISFVTINVARDVAKAPPVNAAPTVQPIVAPGVVNTAPAQVTNYTV